jgi:hypothetical protein
MPNGLKCFFNISFLILNYFHILLKVSFLLNEEINLERMTEIFKPFPERVKKNTFRKVR